MVEERGLAQVSDETELAKVIDEIIANHVDESEKYRAGDDKARKKLQGFFIGKAMQPTHGQANGQVLKRLLDERLGG